jgi:tetratricopeptide (TPR) repeat protein
MRRRGGWFFTCVSIVLLLQVHPATAQGGAQMRDLPILMRQITDLAKAGRFAEATPLARRLVAEAERVMGKEHPITATALSSLAELHIAQSQIDAAEPLLQRALAVRTKALGPEHVDVAATLASLANIALTRARYGEADRYLQRALSIRQRNFGTDHADTAMTLASIRHCC